MKTTLNLSIGSIILSSVFLNNKKWDANDNNYNNHKITVSFNGKKLSFDFWNSLSEGEIKTEDSLIGALDCFLSDSNAGEQSFEDFCSEFGYDEDSRKAEKIHNSCIKSFDKFNRVFDCDLYDLSDELREKYDI